MSESKVTAVLSQTLGAVRYSLEECDITLLSTGAISVSTYAGDEPQIATISPGDVEILRLAVAHMERGGFPK